MTPGTVRRLHGQGLSYGRLSQVLGLPKSTLAARGAEKRTPRLTKERTSGRRCSSATADQGAEEP